MAKLLPGCAVIRPESGAISTWSGTFPSPRASMFLWMCFPRRCPVHLGRLWIAVGSSESELAVDFTVWVLAQWNCSPATKSSVGGNCLPKSPQLEFPAGELLSCYGGLTLLAEILHCLSQIHRFCSLWFLTWLHSSFSNELLQDLTGSDWFPDQWLISQDSPPLLCSMEWVVSSPLSWHMSLSHAVQLHIFFGHNEAIRLKDTN